jgi:hypothetical protein
MNGHETRIGGAMTGDGSVEKMGGAGLSHRE